MLLSEYANCKKARETADVALRDVLHRIYLGVLYFLNVTRFYVTRVNGVSIYARKGSKSYFTFRFSPNSPDTQQRYVQILPFKSDICLTVHH